MANVLRCDPELHSDGETTLETELKKLPSEYIALMNCRLDGVGEIDAIVLAPHAIYVIEDKGWGGEISGDNATWYVNNKKEKNYLSQIEDKAQKIKTRLSRYFSGFSYLAVQSCVTLSNLKTPSLDRLECSRRQYILSFREINAFLQRQENLEHGSANPLTGRYQSMLRRAFLSGFYRLEQIEHLGVRYVVQRIAYAHNRYLPLLTNSDHGTSIFKCYKLPAKTSQDDLEKFVEAHRKVMKRYSDVLEQLKEESRPENSNYIELGNESFIYRGYYIVPTHWHSGNWDLLSSRYKNFTSREFNIRLEIAAQICRGLAYAHSQSIVHRNLSLESILVSDSGAARIIDWDFAIFWDVVNQKQFSGRTFKWTDSPDDMKAEMLSDLQDTERFQAPEFRKYQAGRDTANQMAIENVAYELACPETDLFSLGVVLYELLTGRKFSELKNENHAILSTCAIAKELRDAILALCSDEPSDRKQQSLDHLAGLFSQQAEQKYLPEIKPNYIWSVRAPQERRFTNASNRIETRMSVLYRMQQEIPDQRSVLVKFLKTESSEDAVAEQNDIESLLSKIAPPFSPAWVTGGNVMIGSDGHFKYKHPLEEDARLRFYQVFDYVEGQSIHDAILAGKFSDTGQVLNLGLYILRAVQAIHDAGWVHYDIKPDNFILIPEWETLLKNPDEQVVKIIDFGSAHQVDTDPTRKSHSPGFKYPQSYDVRGTAKYQIDLNSAVLVIIAMLCGINPAPNYGPNLDGEILAEKIKGKALELLINMSLSDRFSWKYKTISQFIADWEECLLPEPKEIEESTITLDLDSGNVHQADLYLQKIRQLTEEIITPINNRLKENHALTILEEQSSELNQQAADRLKLIDAQIQGLEALRIQFGANKLGAVDLVQLKYDRSLLDLKRCLAWTFDNPPDFELTSSIDKARAYKLEKGEMADGSISRLLDVADERRNNLTADEVFIASTQQRTEGLKELLSELTVSDALIEEVRQFQENFKLIIEKTQKFEHLGITHISINRDIGQRVLEKIDSEEKRTQIRTVVIEATKQFEGKARAVLDSDPASALQWFETVRVLSELLDEVKDAAYLQQINDLKTKINNNLECWRQANSFLLEAQKVLVSVVELEPSQAVWDGCPYWHACELVQQAIDAYKYHSGIHDQAEKCVISVTDYIRSKLEEQKETWKRNWPKREPELIRDWQDERLQSVNLPDWLESGKNIVENDVAESLRFKDRFSQYFVGLLVEELDDRIAKDSVMIIKLCEENSKWVNVQYERRRIIRSTLVDLQAEMDSLKKRPSDVQKELDSFLNEKGKDWITDIEISEFSKQIDNKLDVPNLVSKSRNAFARSSWAESINSCKLIQKKERIARLRLGADIDETYRAQYLSEGSTNTPAGGYQHLVLTIECLAQLHQAAESINALWKTKDYDDAESHLTTFNTYHIPDSTLVSEIRLSCALDERKKEFEARKRFGDEHYFQNIRLNTLAQRLWKECAELDQANATKEWLKTAERLLQNLVDFDLEDATLWVGKRDTWLENITSSLLQQLSIWIMGAQSEPLLGNEALELAHNGLILLRRAGMWWQIDGNQRHWVVFNYYKRRAENKPIDRLDLIFKDWREALAELPDDLAIIEEFKKAQQAYWYALLDEALNEFARDPKAKNHLEKLFALDGSAAPLLFASVRTLDRGEVKIPVDEFRKDIDILRLSFQKMQDADKALANNPAALEYVLRDLKKDSKDFDRPELRVKADELARAFVDKKINEGDGLFTDMNYAKAGRCYVQAYALAPENQRCKEITLAKKNAIVTYWSQLQQKIKGLDIMGGTIQSQLREANQLSLDLDGIEAVAPHLQLKSISVVRATLTDKSNALLTWLDLLQQFSPDSSTWINAIRPGRSKETSRSAWNILINYFKGLEKSISSYQTQEVHHPQEVHHQVETIKEYIHKFEPAVACIQINKNILQDGLEKSVIPLESLLESCFLINRSAAVLTEQEPEYHTIWSEWDHAVSTYPRMYSKQSDVYSSWRFTISSIDGSPVLPYWLDSSRFNEWKDWLPKFVLSEKPEQTRDYDAKAASTQFDFQFDLTGNFNLESWKSFWIRVKEDQIDVRALLESDYKSHMSFLGSFCMLALLDLNEWQEWASTIVNEEEDFSSLRDVLLVQNRTWMTTESMKSVQDVLTKSIEKSKGIASKKTLSPNSGRKKNDVNKHLDLMINSSKILEKKIDEYERHFDNLKNNFNGQFKYGNVSSIIERNAPYDLINDLVTYTEKNELFTVESAMTPLSISIDDIEARYEMEVRPQNTFYKYVWGLLPKSPNKDLIL